MAFTRKQEESFQAAVFDISVDVERAIDWIQGQCRPEEVFNDDELSEWVINNGFVKEA